MDHRKQMLSKPQPRTKAQISFFRTNPLLLGPLSKVLPIHK